MSSSTSSSCEIKCSNCEVSFTAKKNLYAHNRKFHQDKELNFGHLKCSLCGKRLRYITELIKHIEMVHQDVHLINEKKTFYTEADFEEWKITFEENTCSKYVLKTGSKNMVDGTNIKHFTCYRNGKYYSKVNKTRRVKHIGSNKIDFTCPAYMKVYTTTVNEISEIEVQYQSTHLGHKIETRRLPIRKQDKIFLANKLTQGIPVKEILAEVKSSFPPTKRLSIITRKDLFNICQQFNIDNEIIIENNTINVDKIVKKLQGGSENSLLIYKPFGETLDEYSFIKRDEFLLAVMNRAQIELLEIFGKNGVMIDSSIKSSKHGFYITTLMVNDGCKGFPVAVLYSTEATTETFVPFFSEIKYKITNLVPSFFLSKDEPLFYNAWKLVFGENTQHLIYYWHIRNSWEKILNSLVKTADLHSILRIQLKTMLKETDEKIFKDMTKSFVATYSSIVETKNFTNYFVKNYLNRAENWAYCYQRNATFNTNICFKWWHADIKLERGGIHTIKELDKSLSVVLNSVAKRLLSIIAFIAGDYLTSKTVEIKECHEKLKKLHRDSFKEIIPEKQWVYSKKNTSNELHNYVIECIIKDQCTCNIKCEYCDICIHQYSCTCTDYSARLVICEHIHFLCTNYFVTHCEDSCDKSLEIDLTESGVHQDDGSYDDSLEIDLTESGVHQDDDSDDNSLEIDLTESGVHQDDDSYDNSLEIDLTESGVHQDDDSYDNSLEIDLTDSEVHEDDDSSDTHEMHQEQVKILDVSKLKTSLLKKFESVLQHSNSNEKLQIINETLSSLEEKLSSM